MDDDLKFKCGECGKKFASQQGLSMHTTRSHTITPAPAPKLPIPGESLRVTGLFLGEGEQVEVQAQGIDGVYLLHVVGYRKR